MSVFVEHMRWVTRIAAPILLADVGDHRFGVFGLDLKSGNERVFGIHSDVVSLPVQFKSNGELHLSTSSAKSLGQTFIDVQSGERAQFNFAFFILTPAPLPFSGMNSTPADSRACCMT